MLRHAPPATGARRRPLPCLALSSACLLLSTLSGCGAPFGEHVEHEERRLRALQDKALVVETPPALPVVAGEEVTATVKLRILDGFYVPAHGATQRDLMPAWLELPKHMFARVEPVTYPAGKLVRLPGHDEGVLSWEGEVTWTLHLKTHASLKAGQQMLGPTVRYQLCSVRGCEMPQARQVYLVFDVSAAATPAD